MRLEHILLLTAISVAACSKAPAEPKSRSKLSQKAFVAVILDLQRTPPAQHPAILKRHHTTDQELRAFVEQNSVDPVALSIAFDSIQARLDQPIFPPRLPGNLPNLPQNLPPRQPRR